MGAECCSSAKDQDDTNQHGGDSVTDREPEINQTPRIPYRHPLKAPTPQAHRVKEVGCAKGFTDFKASAEVGVLHCYAKWNKADEALANNFLSWSRNPKYKDISFGKYDVEKHPELTAKYKITCMPTVLIFAHKKKVETLEERIPE